MWTGGSQKYKRPEKISESRLDAINTHLYNNRNDSNYLLELSYQLEGMQASVEVVFHEGKPAFVKRKLG